MIKGKPKSKIPFPIRKNHSKNSDKFKTSKNENFKPGYTVYTTDIQGKPIQILCHSKNTKQRIEREKLESN